MKPKLKMFFMLWNQYAGKVAVRDDRLMWAGQQLGKPVDSASHLSNEDFDLLIAELRRQLKQSSARRSNVVGMNGKRDARSTDATKEQVWKVHQVEAYLGWERVPERLSGFLRDKFGVDDAR